MHDRPLLAPPSPLREWPAALPAGTLRSIVLHWTAGDYTTVFPAYHFCIAGADDPVVHHTHDLRANMRDLPAAPHEPYAAHVAGRNAFAAGIAACAMQGARPDDFGAYPITPAQVEALCRVAAALAAAYRIPLAAIRTHAEAALDDGYFGDAGEDVRWDIARLVPAPGPLRAAEAIATGDGFRARIAALLRDAP